MITKFCTSLFYLYLVCVVVPSTPYSPPGLPVATVPAYLSVRSDGTIAALKSDMSVVWSAGISGVYSPQGLQLLDTRNLCLYSAGYPYWCSNPTSLVFPASDALSTFISSGSSASTLLQFLYSESNFYIVLKYLYTSTFSVLFVSVYIIIYFSCLCVPNCAF